MTKTAEQFLKMISPNLINDNFLTLLLVAKETEVLYFRQVRKMGIKIRQSKHCRNFVVAKNTKSFLKRSLQVQKAKMLQVGITKMLY